MSGSTKAIESTLKKEKEPVSRIQLQAEALAKTLLQELLLDKDQPDLRNKADLVKVYHSAPVDRSKLDFQQLNKKDIAKTILSPRLADDTLCDIFCVACRKPVDESGTDIEHVQPYADLCDKQRTLLAFLNNINNAEFSAFFLAAEGMSDYFYKDGDLIKMTAYFVKRCYTSMGNLSLICHSCNIKKSTREPVGWLKLQIYFGDRFDQHLQQAGGLQNGVIFSRVYQRGEQPEIILGNRSVPLHTGAGVVLGAFANRWVFEDHKSEIDAHRVFHARIFAPVRRDLDVVAQIPEEQRDSKKQKQRTVDRGIFVAEAAYNTQTAALEQPRSLSSSDDSNDKALRKKGVKVDEKLSHYVKDIKRLFNDWSDDIHEWFENNYDDFCLVLFEKDDWERLVTHCSDKKNHINDYTTLADELAGIAMQLFDDVMARKRLGAAKKKNSGGL